MTTDPNRAVRYRQYGTAAEVVAVEAEALPVPADNEALVRTRYVPVHRGDLLAIAGSPAFGDAATLPDGGAVPGLEGVGAVEGLGASVTDFATGQRVAYFPAPGTWRSRVAVSHDALVALPDDVPDTLAARLLIDVATANLIVRRALTALDERGASRRVIQTGAGSSVGRIVSVLLAEATIEAVRLVHGEAGAGVAAALLPTMPVIATASPDWPARLDNVLGGDLPAVTIDGVGGDLLGVVAARTAADGVIVQFGTLGGTRADIRPIVPRRLCIVGVSVGSWPGLPAEMRARDVATAIRLARTRPELFGGATVFAVDDVAAALAAMDAPDRQGGVVIAF